MLGTVIQEKTSISATFPNCALYVSLYSSCVVPPLASAQTQHAFPIVKESPQAAGLSYFLPPFEGNYYLQRSYTGQGIMFVISWE